MENHRQLLVGAVGAVRFNMRRVGPSIRRVCDSIEPILDTCHLFSAAPFRTLSIIIRVDSVDTQSLVIDKINRQHMELPVTISVPKTSLEDCAQNDLDVTIRNTVLYCIEKVAMSHHLDASLFFFLCDKEFNQQ